MSWTGFRELGLWSKPSGTPFVCIEPWRGYASPLSFDGEFVDKPGLMKIARGEEELLTYRITVGLTAPFNVHICQITNGNSLFV
jgi:hypothetical protein